MTLKDLLKEEKPKTTERPSMMDNIKSVTIFSMIIFLSFLLIYTLGPYMLGTDVDIEGEIVGKETIGVNLFYIIVDTDDGMKEINSKELYYRYDIGDQINVMVNSRIVKDV